MKDLKKIKLCECVRHIGLSEEDYRVPPYVVVQRVRLISRLNERAFCLILSPRINLKPMNLHII